MSYKYDAQEVEKLLESYIELIKDEVPNEMYIAGGGDCPYVWIEVVISEGDIIEFGIGDNNDCRGVGGKFYYSKQDLDTLEVFEAFLEEKQTKETVKKFMLEYISKQRKKCTYPMSEFYTYED